MNTRIKKCVITVVVIGAIVGSAFVIFVYAQCRKHGSLVSDLEEKRFWVTQEGWCCQITGVAYLMKEPLDLRDTSTVQRIFAIPTLSELRLHKVSFWDTDMALFVPMPRLTVLDLQFSSVGDSQLKLFQHSPLIKLNLMGTEITDQTGTLIAGFGDLEYLDISLTRATDRLLCKLESLRRVRILDISGTRITSDGVACISAMTSLEQFYASDTLVDDAMWQVLARLPNLELVEIFGTTVSPIGAAEFASRRPDVRLRMPRDIEEYIRKNKDY